MESTELISMQPEIHQSPFLAVDRFGIVDRPEELGVVAELFPIFEIEDQLVYFNNSGKESSAGLVGETDSITCFLAPSLGSHLSELRDGLKSNRYYLNGHRIVYPTNWCDRVKLSRGEAEVDEYGEVHSKN